MLSECILSGERTRLRPADERDLSAFVKWLADPEVRYWIALPEAPDLAAEEEWLEETRAQEDRLAWAIESSEGQLLGTVELRNVDEYEGRAELGIAIMDKSCWSQGYGSDALRSVLAHSFGELELRRISLTVDADNARAVRCYERLGFAREGVLRAHRLREGEPVDALVMAILRQDWQASLLPPRMDQREGDDPSLALP
ncbi:MAG TPA: GNAT family protein [Dehalococcoidia bacterium]|nr:GNAT family protein [Dehalococcoidia bacterium]